MEGARVWTKASQEEMRFDIITGRSLCQSTGTESATLLTLLQNQVHGHLVTSSS